VQGQEGTPDKSKKVEAGKPKDDPKKTLEDSKMPLTSLEKEAAKGILSAKVNGVELAINLKAMRTRRPPTSR